MTEIHKRTENISHAQFQEGPVTVEFFDGGNRGEMLSQMKETMQHRATLIVLTGDEGSGKTMLCRRLTDEMPISFRTVFFSHTVDSFEEVVRIITVRLGVDISDEKGGIEVDQALDRITDLLMDESADLLVIFDEAENIFLATLERIRKMLDRFIESGARVHLLFAGRKTFLENCDQLSICDFQNSEVLHLDLPPLSEPETADYLIKNIARLAQVDSTEIFTNDTVAEIYALTKGNFRMISTLGEELLNTQGDDASFMVLLEGVEEGRQPEARETGLLRLPYVKKALRTNVFRMSVVACCLVLLFFLFRLGHDVSDPGKDHGLLEENVVRPEGRQEHPQTSDLEISPSATSKIIVEQVREKEISEHMSEIDTDGLQASALEEKNISLLQNDVTQAQTVVEQQTGVKTDETVGSDTIDDGTGKVVAGNEVDDRQVIPEIVKKEQRNIVHLRPAGNQKTKTGVLPEQRRKTIIVQSRATVQHGSASTGLFSVEQRYAERLQAGIEWEKKEKQDLYTIQLMALASETAEKNLKKMLAQDGYEQVVGDFFILRKKTGPEALLVFYGEYPDIERARHAKERLPQFLRDHKPYALSIKGAVAKVK
ncbi:MAG: ATP-binding protein [Desulforhopalus sp.]